MAIKLTMPKAAFDAIALDSTNPLYGLLSYASFVGLKAQIEGSNATIDGITDQGKMTVSIVSTLIGLGAEVENYPAYIKIADANMSDEVPAYVPNRDVTDENGNVTGAKSWADWPDSSHPTHQQDGQNYVQTNGVGGKELKGSVLKQLVDGGYTVLSAVEYEAEVETPPE